MGLGSRLLGMRMSPLDPKETITNDRFAEVPLAPNTCPAMRSPGLTHALLKRLAKREIASQTTASTPTIAPIAEIAESEYQEVAFKRMLYAIRNAHAATASGKPTFIKLGLRSVGSLPQDSHLYSTVTLGCS